MAAECNECEKRLGFFEEKYKYSPEESNSSLIFCVKCNEKYLKNLERELTRLEDEELKSEDGWPLCPICLKEFKSKEEIIKHLIKSKKEFERLKELTKELNKEEVKDSGTFFLEVNISNNYLSKLDKRYPFDLVSDEIPELVHKVLNKWLKEVKFSRDSGWKEELKPKKTIRRESPISPRLRFEILKRDGFTCQYCGNKAPKVELEVDHIEPYSKTKDNSPENLIAACKDCNRGKKAKDII